MVAGWPLITWTARAAVSAHCVGSKFVSSDKSEILESVTEFGYRAIERPAELATDTALGCDVIQHAIEAMARDYNHVPEFILLQHANSPTILPKWIDDCFDLLASKPDATAVVPVVVEMDKHPYRQKRFLDDGSLQPFFPDVKVMSSNRQELPRSVVLAHNFWLIRTPAGQLPVGGPPWPCLGNRIYGFEVSDSLDVHTEDDFAKVAEWLEINLGSDRDRPKNG